MSNPGCAGSCDKEAGAPSPCSCSRPRLPLSPTASPSTTRPTSVDIVGNGGRKLGTCCGAFQLAVRARFREGEPGLDIGDKGNVSGWWPCGEEKVVCICGNEYDDGDVGE